MTKISFKAKLFLNTDTTPRTELLKINSLEAVHNLNFPQKNPLLRHIAVYLFNNFSIRVNKSSFWTGLSM